MNALVCMLAVVGAEPELRHAPLASADPHAGGSGVRRG